MSQAKIKQHAFLLAPVEACKGKSPTPVEIRVVGLGLFDVLEKPPVGLWCTRLVSQEGLLQVLAENGMYRRVGFFWVEDEDWFDQGQPEEIILI